MYTLIPEQSAQHLKREYRIRVLILLFLFMSLGIWIGIVTLFPSYVVSVTQEKRALTEAGAMKQTALSASTTSAGSQIAAANSEIATLQGGQDTLMLSSIIEDISQRLVPGVTVDDFEISRNGATGTNILIQGKAATRQDLVLFEDNLSNDSRFSKVYLPVSDLAADSGITYAMNITGIQ